MWKGYHFSIECKRKGYVFYQKWYIKGWGIGPRGGAPPCKTFSGTPAPGSITFKSVGEILWYYYSNETSSAELCIEQWVYFLGFLKIFLWIFSLVEGLLYVLRKYWSLYNACIVDIYIKCKMLPLKFSQGRGIYNWWGLGRDSRRESKSLTTKKEEITWLLWKCCVRESNVR